MFQTPYPGGSVKNSGLIIRVARFFLAKDTKSRKNVPNEHKMYQMVIKYSKCP
jgi:hypothetical protein